MTKILILGDLHGKFNDLQSVMKSVDFSLRIKYDAVIQVGDFGFYQQCFMGLRDDKLRFHKPVYAIDGNHEKHDWIKQQQPYWEEWKKDFNIHFQPRGSYMDIDGCKIGFLGGALNADRPQEGSIDKRTTNFPLNNEVAEALQLWNSVGGMDIVITHSCPNNLGIGMEGSQYLYESVQKFCVEKGFDPGDFMDCGEAPLRKLYHGLVKKPLWWAYGHFHRTQLKKIDETNFWCVGSTDSSDNKRYVNPIILNTKTKEVEWHDKKAMNFDGEHCTWVK